VRVPAADVDRVCRKFGVTVNDVALAAITEGFRGVLLRRGHEPQADSLRALVPVRSAVLPYLPVEHEDPIQQLRTVHNRWRAWQPGERTPGLVESALSRLPMPLRDNVLELLSRLPEGSIVTLGTHAPGPRRPLRLMGRTLERLLPIPPTAARLSTGVAVLSYGDDVVFGITAEYDAAADVRQLAAGIELGMARMVALSQDSVLLFGKEHRRKRAAGAFGGQAARARH
jgi:WS/DGAT C-terminal domain